MTFDVDAALKLPSGLVLDRSFFYDDIDRAARAMTLTVQYNVTLYKSNPFYVQNRPSLAFHNMNLVDAYLRDPRIAALISNNDHARAVVPMLLSSDDGETLFEPQSYSQKINPRLPEIDVKSYETHTAIYAYHIAQCFAAKGECDAGVEKLVSVQREFASFDDDAVAAEQNPFQYKKFMDDTLARASQRLDDLSAEAMRGLTHAQVNAVNVNNVKYFMQYRACENAQTRKNSISGLVAKIFDKNCALYTQHDRAKTPESPDLPLWREGSAKYHKTALRSLEFLAPLYTLVAGTANGIFYDVAADTALTRIMDYTSLHMPVLALTGPGMRTEPHEYAEQHVFDAFLAERDAMFRDRREKTIWYPLEDTEFMSGYEITAKLLTEKQRGERPDPHLLTNQYDYARRQGYRKQFDMNLDRARHGLQTQLSL